jgi:hypothetical protein
MQNRVGLQNLHRQPRADGRREKAIVFAERDRLVLRVLEDPVYGAYSRVEAEQGMSYAISLMDSTQTKGTHRARVRYWFLKNSLGANFHGGAIGGRRRATFSLEEKPVVKEYLVQYFAAFPNATLIMAGEELTEAFQREVSRKVRESSSSNAFHVF